MCAIFPFYVWCLTREPHKVHLQASIVTLV